MDLVGLEGGAHLLLALAGFNFARFQLSAPGGARTRLRHGLAGLAQLVVPAVLWVGGVALVLGSYDLTTVLFVREVVNGSEWDDQWQLWFLESLVWLTAAALAVTTLPVLHRLERRTPFRFALGVLAVAPGGPLRRGRPARRPDRALHHARRGVLLRPRLGGRARARPPGSASSSPAWPCVLVVGFFGEVHREVIVLGGFLLLLWRPHVPVTPLLARVAGVLATASLFIYLTHWQVYPPLEDAGHQWLALVASLTVGIAYAYVVRPVHQAVGRAVLGSR